MRITPLKLKKLVIFLLVVLICGCGGGGGDGGNSNNPPSGPGPDDDTPQTQDPDEPDCSIEISYFMQNLNTTFPDYLPSWEQLDCYVEDLVRLQSPDFLLMLGDAEPEIFTENDNPPPYWDYIQDILALGEAWPEANTYTPNLGEVPPYLIGDDNTYDETEWDQKLRGIATFGIFLKSRGERIKVDFFYPPFLFEPGVGPFTEMDTKEDFLAWWQNHYIPERVSLAKVAELIKAEYFQPWDIEPGQFVRTFGDAWLDQLSEEEQITLTQQIIDDLYDAVRPEFSGTLVLINYDRFAAAGEHWKNLNLSEWDQVSFILFTEGDVEGNNAYLEEQLSGYTTMVTRDGIANWIVEASIHKDHHQALLESLGTGEDYEDIEADIYSSFFTAIDNLPIEINGVGVSAGNILTAEADAVVRQNFERLQEEHQ